jgi:uncharacterized protein (TIGR03067 family)
MTLLFVNGEEVPAEEIRTGELVINEDEYRPQLGANVEATTIRLDSSKNPKEIDFTHTAGFQKGKTTKGIYKLEGDSLHICRGLTPDKDRPTEFAAPVNSGLQHVVWKRADTPGGVKLKAIQAELKRFESTWRFVSIDVEGNLVPEELFQADTLVLKGKNFTSNVRGEITHGVFKIDPTANPKTIDITFTDGPGKDNTQKGIYELDGDTQKICIARPGEARPKSFDTKSASGHMIEVLKREKAQAPKGRR